MMLVHIRQEDVAERVHNAWLKTIEDGVHTYDIYTEGLSREKVGTKEFARAVVARVGQRPEKLKPVAYAARAGQKPRDAAPAERPAPRKETVGVDVFLDWKGGSPQDLGRRLSPLAAGSFRLEKISNRGIEVWPSGFPETFCTDHWCCRFLAEGRAAVTHADIAALLARLGAAGLDFIKTENLCVFDGQKAYSSAD
jgi:isocitrate dehydrogenase